jgi:hypothetical protein
MSLVFIKEFDQNAFISVSMQPNAMKYNTKRLSVKDYTFICHLYFTDYVSCIWNNDSWSVMVDAFSDNGWTRFLLSSHYTIHIHHNLKTRTWFLIYQCRHKKKEKISLKKYFQRYIFCSSISFLKQTVFCYLKLTKSSFKVNKISK